MNIPPYSFLSNCMACMYGNIPTNMPRPAGTYAAGTSIAALASCASKRWPAPAYPPSHSENFSTWEAYVAHGKALLLRCQIELATSKRAKLEAITMKAISGGYPRGKRKKKKRRTFWKEKVLLHPARRRNNTDQC